MRSGLIVTVAVGLAAIAARLLAPAPIADLVAVAYLVSATTTFGPLWSAAATPQHASRRRR
jgi:hypothetical protein